MKPLSKNLVFILSFVLCLFIFDDCFFGRLNFSLPNESPWNTNHFFNFLYEYKRIASEKKTKPRLILVGSSIAYYSFQAKDLEKELLQKWDLDVEVCFLAYAGNSPLYVYLLLEWLFPLQPDLVVYPINFIDYRLHRTYVLFPEGSNETVTETTMVRDALTFAEAPQSLWIFPWETLVEVGGLMDWKERSEYLMSALFRFVRYREFYLTNWQNIYNHRFGRNTSYHAYMGVDIPEGISSLGWTGKVFSFQPTDSMFVGGKGIWLEITPFLLREGPVNLEIKSKDGRNSQTETFHSPGWKQIFLQKKFQSTEGIIRAELSKIWYAHEAAGAYLDYHRDPMGVRLPQTFGLEEPLQGQQYIRPKRTEDFRFIGMPDKEYESYFAYRLLQGLEKRPGIGYLVALERAKKRIADESFRPYFHFRYLKKISETFEAKNIPLLIINNPENPISLSWYERSSWYRDHLAYLQTLQGKHVRFVDLKGALPMQAFSDFHHFTYPGMEQMNPIYAEQIGNLFSK
ncbi:hypothetical protein LPTSP4_34730 [Leptospira ryugenii]|uniref:DUF1574 domain-containing protein n=1 Tax=Leptospira ryugenii TaxID=1917863 RepID=A0A2P2E4X1_9LEPT|nr:hypothetical protein [Leptospira ryugenii]GBF51935.1 hypothetical protein LPTSP4_34730 [Leptospira ryugenii]